MPGHHRRRCFSQGSGKPRIYFALPRVGGGRACRLSSGQDNNFGSNHRKLGSGSMAKSSSNGEPASRPSRFRGPLRNRNFVFLWLGQTVSSIGNGMYTITLAWSVYSSTGSSSDMGLVLAANVVPNLAFTLFGGVLADRLQRKTIIVWTNLASTAVTAGLAVAALTHRLEIGGILLASFAL